jgi:DNA replication protein DnaC
MSYNLKNYSLLKQQYREKRAKAQEEARIRQAKLYAQIPELAQVDTLLSQTTARLMKALVDGEDMAQKSAMIQAENAELQAARKELLVSRGYDADATEPQYECPLCQDTGAVGIQMCACMKKALIEMEYQTSGLGELMKTQSFDTFDLKYYLIDQEAYACASRVLEAAKEYAQNFEVKTSDHLLFMGNTGLGKTHLCTAIAKEVIDNGYHVIYETAQDFFETMSEAQFGNGEKPDTRKYFDCDLLILDDLGTELTNQFTISCLYNLINTRLNRHMPMILNTNLEQDEIAQRYSDRIASRIFGMFRPFLFLGMDIRQQKLI